MSRSQKETLFRQTVTDREYVMPFGQYKGLTIDTILFRRPQYLVWLVNNTDFDLDHKLLEEAEESSGMIKT